MVVDEHYCDQCIHCVQSALAFPCNDCKTINRNGTMDYYKDRYDESYGINEKYYADYPDYGDMQ